MRDHEVFKLMRLIIVVVSMCLVLGWSTYSSAEESVAPGCAAIGGADVWLVRSGGLWSSGKKYGNYRAVVIREGVEHSRDHVEVQIVRIVDDEKRIVDTCFSIPSPGVKGHVQDLKLHSISEEAAVIELEIEMKAMEGISLQEVFLVSTGRSVLRVAAAEYVDISSFKEGAGR